MAQARRLTRLEAEEIHTASGAAMGSLTCKFTYREADGSPSEGQVRFFLPAELLRCAPDPPAFPLLHCAGYEIDEATASRWVDEGFVVTTVHGHPLNPVSRGPNLECALLHVVRLLPFIDDERVFLWGASAGGYMALALAAQSFPLAGVSADVPPVNLGYNLAYLARNQRLAEEPDRTGVPQFPIFAQVCKILSETVPRSGPDYASPAYYLVSPVAQTSRISAPVLATFSTADLLVPIDQVSAGLVRPPEAGTFPPGYTYRMPELMPAPEFRTRLFDVIDESARRLFVTSPPESAPLIPPPPHPAPAPVSLPLPFSCDRQWSIVIFDEGAPEPHIGHTRFAIQPDHSKFRNRLLKRGIQPEQLTPAVLETLMQRYLGLEIQQVTARPAGRPPYRVRRLDYPAAERVDVLRGLRTFARNDARALHLARLYENLPQALKVFGPRLGAGSPGSVRRAIAALSSSGGGEIG